MWLAQLPAEVDLAPITQRWEVDQPSVEVFEQDASFTQRSGEAGNLPFGGGAFELVLAQCIWRHVAIAKHLRPVSGHCCVVRRLVMAQPLNLTQHRRDAREQRFSLGAGKEIWHGSSCQG
jgi:hypothetical protein